MGLPPVCAGAVKAISALANPAAAVPITGGFGAIGVMVTLCVAAAASL